jgi:hypothetical protein
MRRKIERDILLFLLALSFQITRRLAVAYGRRLDRDLDRDGRDKKTRAKLEQYVAQEANR